MCLRHVAADRGTGALRGIGPCATDVRESRGRRGVAQAPRLRACEVEARLSPERRTRQRRGQEDEEVLLEAQARSRVAASQAYRTSARGASPTHAQSV